MNTYRYKYSTRDTKSGLSYVGIGLDGGRTVDASLEKQTCVAWTGTQQGKEEEA
jgi:hypothetical protein